jgi:hypothetical protein
MGPGSGNTAQERTREGETNEFGHPLPSIYYELICRLNVRIRESFEEGKLFVNIMRMYVRIYFYPCDVSHRMGRRCRRRF